MSVDVAALNQLRLSVTAAWEAPGDRPTPLVRLIDEDGDRQTVGDALRTLCSELGVRYVRVDLAQGLTPEIEATLQRSARNPRMVVLTSLDGLGPDAASLHDRLCDGAARTLPVVVCPMPADAIGPTTAAWRRLREIETREAPAA